MMGKVVAVRKVYVGGRVLIVGLGLDMCVRL
jgi:hypothetical protein